MSAVDAASPMAGEFTLVRPLRAGARGFRLAAALAFATFAVSQPADARSNGDYPPIDTGMVYIDPQLMPSRAAFAEHVDDELGLNPLEASLREGLAAYRERWASLPQVRVPPGGTLKRGDSGARVRLLRIRLGLSDEGTFDRELAQEVREFRRAHGLASGSEADAQTIASLNLGADHYERIILANLERARALPSDPGRRFILVDAGSARLWMYEDGEVAGTMRVIVGKESRHTQTPMLAGLIRYAIVNPYWNVPPDLVRDKIAPGVLSEGHRYLRDRRYEILSDWAEDAQILSPDEVDWDAVASGDIDLRVRQLPGPNNGMGDIKFMFPNRFGVYLHDTPDKALFEDDERRFSSGCVRIEDARRLARWIFGEMPDATPRAREERVDVADPVPVYITYLTALPSPDGIAFRRDAYGRDAELIADLDRRETLARRRGGGGDDSAAYR